VASKLKSTSFDRRKFVCDITLSTQVKMKEAPVGPIARSLYRWHINADHSLSRKAATPGPILFTDAYRFLGLGCGLLLEME